MGNKITAFNEIKSIRIDNTRIIDFSSPKVMGILNLTPDSFYDGDSYGNVDDLINKTKSMIADGADIIDIGAVSTRPGAKQISIDNEIDRLLTPLSRLVAEFPQTIFSIDTYRSAVAEECIKEGAHIINDISGGTMDGEMFNVISRHKVPYILMHIHGTPEIMQQSPISRDVVNKVHDFFNQQIKKLKELGITNVILDPGFGFGKTLESNYQLLKEMNSLRIDKLPILAGISRKSMINKVLNTSPEQALTGTISLNTIALQSGANILRVHDVKEAKETIELFRFMKNS